MENIKKEEMKNERASSQSKLLANKKSEQIIENTKKLRINEVFDIFDADSDGLISAKKIDIKSI